MCSAVIEGISNHFFNFVNISVIDLCGISDETQNQLAIAVEKERTANDQLLDLSSKLTSLETQNSRLRQEKSQISAQLEVLKNKIELSEENKEK